jgi:hypothetical protein
MIEGYRFLADMNDGEGWIEYEMEDWFFWKDMAEHGMIDGKFAVTGLQLVDWV